MPDLRGLFLRGHGGNSAALGVQQGDAIRNITGGSPTMTGGGVNDQTSGAIGMHVWYRQSANTLGGPGLTYGLNSEHIHNQKLVSPRLCLGTPKV